MNDLLVREICKLAGVTRRAVQGYEKFNLVAPAGKNKMGYLLYDESTIEKIKQIRQFQKRGFSLREISLLNRLSTDELKRSLLCQIMPGIWPSLQKLWKPWKEWKTLKCQMKR